MAVPEPAPAVEAESAAGTESPLTLVVDDVHVTFHVNEERRGGAREMLRRGAHRPTPRTIDAVRGVSFAAKQGEAIGVIGGNGAGKSTLFQVMAGLLPPTRGAVYASSQPALLGVGAALQPKVSGRRNIELGCLALGLTRAELEDRLADIVAFAGLEDFVDLPLRTYSSGMRARLHFAIATAVEPELLLIDEALSVGDAAFKVRSRRRIEELRAKAGTVFLVSHSMGSIGRTCDRVIWMDRGQIVEDGPARSVIKAYQARVEDPDDD